MREKRRIPTERGRFVLHDRKLRARTTLGAQFRTFRTENWDERHHAYKLFFVVSTAMTMWTIARVFDGSVPGGVVGQVALTAALLAPLIFGVETLVGRFRHDRTIPFDEIRTVKRTEDAELRVTTEDEEGAEIEFQSNEDAKEAAALLRLNGIRVRGPEWRSQPVGERGDRRGRDKDRAHGSASERARNREDEREREPS